MSEQAFQQAIFANPADTTARLVFADWLADTGQNDREELIRRVVSHGTDINPADYRLEELLSAVYTLEPETAASRLREAGFTLPDILLRFAGHAPDFADGLPQAVLVEWCKATEPEHFANTIASVRPYPIAVLFPKRWEAIAGAHGRGRGGSHWGHYYPDGHPQQQARQREIRDLKRRVLALFPEVKWSYQMCLNTAEIMPRENVRGYLERTKPRFIRPDLPFEINNDYMRPPGSRLIYQTISATQLIPQEPLNFRDVPWSNVRIDPFDNFDALLQQARRHSRTPT